ncbi:hypothetical protein BpHYR1_044902 [Brachionus plicatilis]|uniref:Uncharacterized protein n=1 Tax=Brachionus plicatilis TaxID=10195 RepID=A0A3M7P3F7_BRAPC|nr:hypothetical protein BpHYR1_044902 [Brachionus plicatilis]
MDSFRLNMSLMAHGPETNLSISVRAFVINVQAIVGKDQVKSIWRNRSCAIDQNFGPIRRNHLKFTIQIIE